MSMKAEPLIAQFTLQADAVRYLTEAELGDGYAQALAVSDAQNPPFGQLVLSGAGQPPIGLYDDLIPLAHGLHGLLPKLREGQGTALGSYAQPDVLTFTADGQTMVVTDEGGQERR
jgi:hypothetical protein